jgi:hypothetical protein
MQNKMQDLNLIDHLPMIKELVGKHILAQIQLVTTKESINGKLGQARWGHPTELPSITLPARISAEKIEESLLALSMRGLIDSNPAISDFANSVDDSELYLKHLVLHEVAHIVNNWPQSKETDCDLWAIRQL